MSNKLALNFLLARRTLGENICLSCLKFNLSRAPGQVIFLPLISVWKFPFQSLDHQTSQTLEPINNYKVFIVCFIISWLKHFSRWIKNILPMWISFSIHHHYHKRRLNLKKISPLAVFVCQISIFLHFRQKLFNTENECVNTLILHNAHNGILLHHCDAWFCVMFLTIPLFHCCVCIPQWSFPHVNTDI